jgi:hypothetical protein
MPGSAWSATAGAIRLLSSPIRIEWGKVDPRDYERLESVEALRDDTAEQRAPAGMSLSVCEPAIGGTLLAKPAHGRRAPKQQVK